MANRRLVQGRLWKTIVFLTLTASFAVAQTRITPPKDKDAPAQDVKLGQPLPPQSSAAASRPAGRDPGDQYAKWPRLFISDPVERRFLRRALEGASLLLSTGQCPTIFSGFRDRNGRALGEELARLAVSPEAYLRLIVFVDGAGRSCDGDSLAFTVVGSRVVHLCAGFERRWQHNPDHAQASLIHEALHTLGLGENPPASADITHRVRKLCREGKPVRTVHALQK